MYAQQITLKFVSLKIRVNQPIIQNLMVKTLSVIVCGLTIIQFLSD